MRGISSPRRRLGYLLPLMLFALVFAGCAKKKYIRVTNYPQFDDEGIKSIAVLPFRNTTGVKDAGIIVSDSFAAALMRTKAYKVYNRNDLALLLAAKIACNACISAKKLAASEGVSPCLRARRSIFGDASWLSD